MKTHGPTGVDFKLSRLGRACAAMTAWNIANDHSAECLCEGVQDAMTDLLHLLDSLNGAECCGRGSIREAVEMAIVNFEWEIGRDA